MIDNRIASALASLLLLALAGCPDKVGTRAPPAPAPAKSAQPLTLMVVEDDKLVGLVHLHDLLRIGAA